MEINIQNLNTVSEIEKTRNELIEALDNRLDFVTNCINADKVSHKSFGYIKEAFENISPKLFSTKQGKGVIKEYTNTIKTNKNLSSMHSIYENLRKADSSADLDFFIKTITNVDWNIDTKTLSEDTYKLGRILAEGLIYIGKEAFSLLPEEQKDYSEAVEYIIEHKMTRNNIAEYSNAVKTIKEGLIKKESVDRIKLKKVDIDELVESMITDFNEKYANKLTEAEYNAIKELCESEDREKVFESYKTSCIEKLHEAKKRYETDKNQDAVEKLKTIIEQVDNKKYSLDSLTTDISKFVELKEVF